MKTSDSFKAMSANTKIVAWPAMLMVILVVLFIVVAKTGIGKVLSLRKEIKESRELDVSLSQKLSILQTSQESALPLADLSVVAIPPDNPALTIISEMKKLAADKDITLGGVEAKETSGDETTSVSNVEIDFTLDGQAGAIFDYLKTLKGLSPLLTIHEVKISKETTNTHAQVAIAGYFAPFPEVLPSISSPLNELTAEEKDILARISSFTQPTFTEISPSGPYQRSDLFNF